MSPVQLVRSLVFLVALTCAGATGRAQEPPSAEQLLKDLGCARCHDGIPPDSSIREKAPDFSEAGLRYNPDYLLGFLRYPVKIRQQLGTSRMPNFRLDERESLALTMFLGEQIPAGRERPSFGPQQAYEQARTRYPAVTAAQGKDMFRALGCVGCHKQASIKPWSKKNAPDLSIEGGRVRADWLKGFLKDPTPLRPFGFYPGTGSRHPDFQLTDQEAEILAKYVEQRRGRLDSLPPSSFKPETLLVFSMGKAAALLRDKLPCLGCHRLGQDGGMIGPDLSSLTTRLKGEFVYEMLRDPQKVMPETVMPRVDLTPELLSLITNYLMQQELPREPVPAFSLAVVAPQFYEDAVGARSLHLKYCAPCHGARGDREGYNARYLPVPPAKHADSSYIAMRPDAVLFDGISAGGYVLNKSNRMPAWGGTLDSRAIWGLVAYIRQLCGCQGPAWSREPR